MPNLLHAHTKIIELDAQGSGGHVTSLWCPWSEEGRGRRLAVMMMLGVGAVAGLAVTLRHFNTIKLIM